MKENDKKNRKEEMRKGNEKMVCVGMVSWGVPRAAPHDRDFRDHHPIGHSFSRNFVRSLVRFALVSIALLICSCKGSKVVTQAIDRKDSGSIDTHFGIDVQASGSRDSMSIESLLTQIIATGCIQIDVVEEVSIDKEKVEHRRKEWHLQASYAQKTEQHSEKQAATSQIDTISAAIGYQQEQEYRTSISEHTTKASRTGFNWLNFSILGILLALLIIWRTGIISRIKSVYKAAKWLFFS